MSYYLNAQIDVASVITSCPASFVLDLLEDDIARETSEKIRFNKREMYLVFGKYQGSFLQNPSC